jgi:hypothetical protein
LLSPRRRGLVEVRDVQVLVQDLEVRLPAEPAAEEIIPIAEPRQHAGGDHAVDQAPVPDEVDALDARRAVGDARTREQRVHRTAALVDGGVDRRLVGEVERMLFTPVSVTGARSMTTTSAPASCASSATAAPMPVAPPTTSARLPSYLNASNRVIDRS